MTSRERLLAALHRQPVDRIPYFESLFDISVAERLAGGPEHLTSNPAILEMLRSDNPRVRFRAGTLLQPEISALTGRDNITFWDSFYPFPGPRLYVLDPSEDHLGYSADGAIKGHADLDKLVMRELDADFWSQARSFVARKGEFAAGAILFLGIDPTWHCIGFQRFGVALIEDPGFVEEVLGCVTGWLSKLVAGLCALDFDFLIVADDIAYKMGPFFSPRLYRRVLQPHVSTVAARITKPWIFHSDGNIAPLLDDLLELGMNAIHPMEPGSMDPVYLKKRYGNRLALVGNIDIDTLSRGTPAEVRREVRERVAQLGPGYGYLLSSSNSIAPGCRPENVAAMLEAHREFGSYPLKV
jgi:hypothetical protein